MEIKESKFIHKSAIVYNPLILSLYTFLCSTQTQVPEERPRPDPSVTIRAKEVCAVITVDNVVAFCGNAFAVSVRVQIARFRDGCERDYEVSRVGDRIGIYSQISIYSKKINHDLL